MAAAAERTLLPAQSTLALLPREEDLTELTSTEAMAVSGSLVCSRLCEAGARLIQVNVQTCLSYLDRASLEPCLIYLDPARLEKEETVAVRDQGSELPPLVEHILRFVYKVTCGLCGMMLTPQLALEHVPAPNTMNWVCPGTTQEGRAASRALRLPARPLRRGPGVHGGLRLSRC